MKGDKGMKISTEKLFRLCNIVFFLAIFFGSLAPFAMVTWLAALLAYIIQSVRNKRITFATWWYAALAVFVAVLLILYLLHKI